MDYEVPAGYVALNERVTFRIPQSALASVAQGLIVFAEKYNEVQRRKQLTVDAADTNFSQLTEVGLGCGLDLERGELSLPLFLVTIDFFTRAISDPQICIKREVLMPFVLERVITVPTKSPTIEKLIWLLYAK